MSVLDLATDERRDLLELLRNLDEPDWDAPTLCTGWTVRDVVAHIVSYDGVGPAGLIKRFVQGRLWLSEINQVSLSALRDRPPAELIQAVEDNLRPSGLTAGFGGRIALTDGLIHQQDIRRPLDVPRHVPPDRLREALDFARFAPVIRGAWNVRGVRLIASDIDWSFGAGPEARGTGEAVLMTLAGRASVAQELTGPGARRLQDRLG